MEAFFLRKLNQNLQNSKESRHIIWIVGAGASAAGPHKPPGLSGTFPQPLYWGCGLDAMFWPSPYSFELFLQAKHLTLMKKPEAQTHHFMKNHIAAHSLAVLIDHCAPPTCSACFSFSVYSFSSISRIFLQASSWYPPPVSAHKIR